MGRLLAVVLTTAVLALASGTAIGHYIVPNSKGQSAQCIVWANDLRKLTSLNPAAESTAGAQDIVDAYNAECR